MDKIFVRIFLLKGDCRHVESADLTHAISILINTQPAQLQTVKPIAQTRSRQSTTFTSPDTFSSPEGTIREQLYRDNA